MSTKASLVHGDKTADRCGYHIYDDLADSGWNEFDQPRRWVRLDLNAAGEVAAYAVAPLSVTVALPVHVWNAIVALGPMPDPVHISPAL